MFIFMLYNMSFNETFWLPIRYISSSKPLNLNDMKNSIKVGIRSRVDGMIFGLMMDQPRDSKTRLGILKEAKKVLLDRIDSLQTSVVFEIIADEKNSI